MEVIIDKATITQCNLSKNENITLRYEFGLPLYEGERQKLLSISKDKRRNFFLCAMEKLFDVKEAQKERAGG